MLYFLLMVREITIHRINKLYYYKKQTHAIRLTFIITYVHDLIKTYK